MDLVSDVLERDRTKMQRPPLNGHDVMALTGLQVSIYARAAPSDIIHARATPSNIINIYLLVWLTCTPVSEH
jgi:hypothetical protein